MARSTYLGTTNDWLTETTSSGYVKIADDAKTLRFWSAETGGTQYTDLLVDGAAATELVVPANAAFAPAVDGPDGVNDGMWLEVVGVTTRVFVTPSKPLTEAKAYADTQVATRETPAGAQAKANAAEANAKAASIPLTQKGAANGVAALGADGRAAEAQLPAHLAQTSLNAAYGPHRAVPDQSTKYLGPGSDSTGWTFGPAVDAAATSANWSVASGVLTRTNTTSTADDVALRSERFVDGRIGALLESRRNATTQTRYLGLIVRAEGTDRVVALLDDRTAGGFARSYSLQVVGWLTVALMPPPPHARRAPGPTATAVGSVYPRRGATVARYGATAAAGPNAAMRRR